MSEKRFERWNDHSCKVKDNQEDTLLNWEDVVDLLNEQQATISALKEENEQLMIENAKLNIAREPQKMSVFLSKGLIVIKMAYRKIIQVLFVIVG